MKLSAVARPLSKSVFGTSAKSFSTSSIASTRLRPGIAIRPPIPPTVKNIEVSDNHPLWQFFSEKKFLRAADELSKAGKLKIRNFLFFFVGEYDLILSHSNSCIWLGRPWTIQELRRKSFEDLHTIWYVCVKERNILEREGRIYQIYHDSDSNPFSRQSAKVRDTMWRIRHVLAERQTAWENSLSDFKENYTDLIADFENGYLNADDSLDAEMEARLERFLNAFYGIKQAEDISPSVVDTNFINGVKVAAKLKLARFEGTLDQPSAEAFGEGPRDVIEAYELYLAPHSPEGIQSTASALLNKRNDSPNYSPIPKYLEIEVLSNHIKEMIGEEKPAEL